MEKQEHLLIKALLGQEVERPPVWMMRQAGRYLPEYIEIRKKYDFFTRVQTPELACEITIQPIDIVGVDAAILFSDILVVPQAMGMEVQMIQGKGPYFPRTIQNEDDIDRLIVNDAPGDLEYVYDAIKVTKEALNNRVPLIGFAGAPFTLLCYMIEGQGSKNFSKAKEFCFARPDLAHKLLTKITDVAIAYLTQKVKAGADVIQVFDSWSGLLSPTDFAIFSQPYLEKISDAISKLTPVILFPKGSWYALESLSKSSASAIGLDWTTSAAQARQWTNNEITLQGNFDPSKLLSSVSTIQEETKKMLTDFGRQNYIANLGHGILPNVPVEHAKAFVDTVKDFKYDEQ